MVARPPALFILLLALAAGTALLAEEPVYERASSNDIILGYVPDGRWVETRGHLWLSPAGVFLNFNLPSAMVPLRIDVTNVAPDTISQLKTECSAPRQFDGGCNAIVRGQTATMSKRRGIVAHEIRILPP